MRIENEFGKKIGGSKRDLWKLRGLMLSDLADMNDAEKEKYVCKSNVWPIPDYEKMKEDGYDILVLYFIKLVKDAIATKPVKGDNEAYIKTVSEIRDAAMALKTVSECINFCKNFIIANGYVYKNSYRCEASYEFRNIGGEKLFNKINRISTADLHREVKKKQFLFTELDKFKSCFEVCCKSGYVAEEFEDGSPGVKMKSSFGWTRIKDVSIEDFNSMKDNQFFILTTRRSYLSGGYESKAAAETALEELYEKEKTKENGILSRKQAEKEAKRKGKFIPRQLRGLQRIGGENIVTKRITGQDYLDRFGFYGGEFGNYLNEDDRQISLNMGYEAFHDLAIALNINDSEIAFGEKLAIAFGARGHGNAAAHYEPARQVINLTKMRGAGTLAHEYGHALDDILSKKYGNKGFFTETKGKCCLESMKKLIDAMKYKEVEKQIYAADFEETNRKYARYIKLTLLQEFYKASEEDKKVVEQYIDNILSVSREDMIALAKENGADKEDMYYFYAVKYYMDALNDMKAKMIPRAKKIRKECENIIRNYMISIITNILRPDSETTKCRVHTNFYDNALQFDREYAKEDKGYWSSTIEMFARAFACFIQDQLQEKGIRNDYLCGHAESGIVYSMEKEKDIHAYPVGEERCRINECISAFIKELKDIGLLSERTEVTPNKCPVSAATIEIAKVVKVTIPDVESFEQLSLF